MRVSTQSQMQLFRLLALPPDVMLQHRDCEHSRHSRVQDSCTHGRDGQHCLTSGVKNHTSLEAITEIIKIPL